MQIVTPEGLLSYPNVAKPKRNLLNKDREELRFSADLIFLKGTNLTTIQNYFTSFCKEKGMPINKCKMALKPCSDMVDPDTGKIKPLYDKGDWYISAWSDEAYPPQLVGPMREKDYPAKNFKAGNLVSFIVNLWTSGNPANHHISAGLLAVQWRGKGESVTTEANINLFQETSPETMEVEPEEESDDNPFGPQTASTTEENPFS